MKLIERISNIPNEFHQKSAFLLAIITDFESDEFQIHLKTGSLRYVSIIFTSIDPQGWRT
jgi:hypothetical protein